MRNGMRLAQTVAPLLLVLLGGIAAAEPSKSLANANIKPINRVSFLPLDSQGRSNCDIQLRDELARRLRYDVDKKIDVDNAKGIANEPNCITWQCLDFVAYHRQADLVASVEFLNAPQRDPLFESNQDNSDTNACKPSKSWRMQSNEVQFVVRLYDSTLGAFLGAAEEQRRQKLRQEFRRGWYSLNDKNCGAVDANDRPILLPGTSSLPVCVAAYIRQEFDKAVIQRREAKKFLLCAQPNYAQFQVDGIPRNPPVSSLFAPENEPFVQNVLSPEQPPAEQKQPTREWLRREQLKQELRQGDKWKRVCQGVIPVLKGQHQVLATAPGFDTGRGIIRSNPKNDSPPPGFIEILGKSGALVSMLGGAALTALAAAMLGSGGHALDIAGKCVTPPEPSATCPQIFDSRAFGLGFTTAGAVPLIVGGIALVVGGIKLYRLGHPPDRPPRRQSDGAGMSIALPQLEPPTEVSPLGSPPIPPPLEEP